MVPALPQKMSPPPIESPESRPAPRRRRTSPGRRSTVMPQVSSATRKSRVSSASSGRSTTVSPPASRARLKARWVALLDGGTSSRPLTRRPAGTTPGSIEVEEEAIVTELHAGRQRDRRLRVVDVVSEMGEIGAAGPDARRRGHRLLDREVRGMRPIAQSVEDQRVEPFEQREARL